MEPTNMTPLLEQLEDDIDEVEETLEPLLSQALSATGKKMPVMDKAKLHVLITYTLESLLFSYLRLHGVKAKDHAVFKELTRVRQYFEKIKALETGPEKKRTMTLDKDAAGRFIKHGLAGNDKPDLARAEQQAKEKAMAQLRAAQMAKKKSSVPQKRPVEEQDDEEEEDESKEDEGEDENEGENEDADESPNADDANAAQAGVMEQEVEKMIKAEGTQQSAGLDAAAGGKSKPKTKKEMKRERKEKTKLLKKQRKAARAQAKKAKSKS